jgi:hypothetical protein
MQNAVNAPTFAHLNARSPRGQQIAPGSIQTRVSRALETLGPQTSGGPFSTVSTQKLARKGSFFRIIEIFKTNALLHRAKLNICSFSR